MFRSIARFIAGLWLGYVLLVIILYAGQRDLLYPAHGEYQASEQLGLEGVEKVVFDTPRGFKVMAWYSPPKNDDSKVIAYFHGNAENVKTLAPRMKAIQDAGMGFMLLIYRGYPGSEGKPEEYRLYTDAWYAIDFLRKEKQVPDERIVIMGRSLGTGIAVEMAQRKHFRQVGLTVLISPYTSVVDVAKLTYWYVPVDVMMVDRYESLSKMSRIKSPVWIFHGTDDTLIPSSHSQKLFDAAQTKKRLVLIDGQGHNDIDVNRIIREVANPGSEFSLP